MSIKEILEEALNLPKGSLKLKSFKVNVEQEIIISEAKSCITENGGKK